MNTISDFLSFERMDEDDLSVMSTGFVKLDGCMFGLNLLYGEESEALRRLPFLLPSLKLMPIV